uniref:Putative secreted peptide n=1 Tax=Anopheles braziliensis TaxID=58242 RepID=A0A2M3ZTL3_9DIPT
MRCLVMLTISAQMRMVVPVEMVAVSVTSWTIWRMSSVSKNRRRNDREIDREAGVVAVAETVIVAHRTRKAIRIDWHAGRNRRNQSRSRNQFRRHESTWKSPVL